MMALFQYISFGCIVFLVSQQVATGLECYVCAACGSSSTSWSTISSSDKGAYCYTYIYNSGMVSYTNRGISTSCLSGPTTGGTNYCCSTDYCNGQVIGNGTGSILLSNSLSLSFAFVIALIVFKQLMNN